MKIIKWTGIVVAGLAGIAVLLGAGLYFVGSARFSKRYEVTPAEVAVPTDSASVIHGAYIYGASCSGCHGEDGGGTDFFSDPGLATFHAPNLTVGEGGIGAFYTDADYVRAIRHGIGPNGEPLAVMPSQAYWHFSDHDLGALIAHLKNMPPVDREWPGRTITPLGKILVAAGVFDILAAEHIDHDGPRGAVPPRGVTPEYGKYLVDTGDCVVCHGPDLSGGSGPEPGAPTAPNLTPGGALQNWSAQDFINTMRTGVTPDGRPLAEAFMPWRELARLNDDDLTAMYMYLQTLETLPDTPRK